MLSKPKLMGKLRRAIPLNPVVRLGRGVGRKTTRQDLGTPNSWPLLPRKKKVKADRARAFLPNSLTCGLLELLEGHKLHASRGKKAVQSSP